MKGKDKIKVLSFVKTSSLIYDERVLKEIDSLLTVDGNKIDLVAIESQKKSNFEIDKVNIDRYRISDFFNKNWITKITYILYVFFLFGLRNSYKSYRVLWVHDPIMILVIPLFKLFYKGKIVWDLHELPPDIFYKYSIFGYVFSFIASISDYVIVANEERGEYLVSENLLNSYLVLNNYPSEGYKSQLNTYRDIEFEKWIADKTVAYCQSATHPSRNFDELVKSCIEQEQYLLVVGSKNNVYEEARSRFDKFDTYINVLGKKPSYSLPYYISKTDFSLIFYSAKNKNNYLCAPNRLFLTLKEGKPVIVGANPPMAKIVKEFKCGVVTSDFGEDYKEIAEAIREMNKNLEFFEGNAKRVSGKYNWENQIDKIKQILHDSAVYH